MSSLKDQFDIIRAHIREEVPVQGNPLLDIGRAICPDKKQPYDAAAFAAEGIDLSEFQQAQSTLFALRTLAYYDNQLSSVIQEGVINRCRRSIEDERLPEEYKVRLREKLARMTGKSAPVTSSPVPTLA